MKVNVNKEKKEGKEYFIKMIVINVMLNDKIEVKEILL